LSLYDDWAVKQKQRRQKFKQGQQVAKVKYTPTSVDVISVELNQMKGSMGITKMGSFRQKFADKPKIKKNSHLIPILQPIATIIRFIWTVICSAKIP